MRGTLVEQQINFKLTIFFLLNTEIHGNEDGEPHPGVTCDGCDKTVVGFRYKCVQCPDYDLCGRCETKRIHPGHNMMRIASPEGVWPQHFFRRLNKMHDRINKRAASASSATGKFFIYFLKLGHTVNS